MVRPDALSMIDDPSHAGAKEILSSPENLLRFLDDNGVDRVCCINYVSPDARFRGVSRALLRALEERAIERGNVRCTLTSTETARRFYQANGYVEDGLLAGKFGTRASYAMSKPLVAVQQ